MSGPTVGAGLTAAAIVLAQPPFDAWWIGSVALVPWLALARSGRVLVATGLAWGTVSGLLMGHWIYFGLRSLGAGQTEAASGLVFAALFVTGLAGALYGVAAVVARRVRVFRSLERAFCFALCVGGIDWLRGVPGLWLPWSLLGHTQATAHGPAQLALVGGVPLVSGLLAGTSFAIADALRGAESARRGWLAWAGAYLALALAGLPTAEALRRPAEGAPIHLLLVQPRIPPGDRWAPTLQRTNVALLGRRTLAAIEGSSTRPDIVLWPETSVTTPLDEDPELREELARWVSRAGAPLVFGGVSPGAAASLYRNSAIWIDEDGHLVDRFDKTLAVPFVEAAPASGLAEIAQRAFGAGSIRRLVEEGTEERPLRGEDLRLAMVLCFEVIHPALVAGRIDEETSLIVNLANDAWYGSPVPGQQQLAFATFRAIEQRRYLVRVADSGPSAVVDPFGRIVRQLEPREIGHLLVEVWASEGPRAVERVAVVAVTLVGALVGLGVEVVARRRRKR